MTPETSFIYAMPEARRLRAEIQSAYNDAVDASRKAEQVERYTSAGFLATSHYDGRPTNRIEKADEIAERNWARYNEAFATYHQWKQAQFAQHGFVSEQWWYFDRPEVRAANSASAEFLAAKNRIAAQWRNDNLAVKLQKLENAFRQLDAAGSADLAVAVARDYVYTEQGRIRGNLHSAPLSDTEKQAKFRSELERVTPAIVRVAMGELWQKWTLWK